MALSCIGALLLTLGLCCVFAGAFSGAAISVPVPTPGPNGYRHNDYRCASVQTPLTDSYIVQYEPKVDPRLAHHMLIFGCRYRPPQGSWDCKSTGYICGVGDTAQIIFAWALNASGIHMPHDVGLKVGPQAHISYVVIQVHYGHAEDIPDLSAISKEALIIHTTRQRQKFVAGIYLMGSAHPVPAGVEAAYIDSACEFKGPKSIYPFAFRTHAHSLGKQIVGYVIKSGEWEVIGTRSPQDPQAFYPVEEEIQVNPGDSLAVRCVYNTSSLAHAVGIGPDTEDEMCNFYLMYYTLNNNVEVKGGCWSPALPSLHFPATLPPLPHVPTGEGHDHDDIHSHPGHNHPQEHPATPPPPPPPPPPPTTVPPPVVTLPPPSSLPTSPPTAMLVPASDWALNTVPIPVSMLGQVTAAAVDSEGNLYILHRGPVVWDADSFRLDYTYKHRADGPIEVSTLLKFSGTTGSPDQAWGASLFYLPHGLTIDHQDNFWVTDVAMHQVFKFTSPTSTTPSLVLGKAFTPGAGYNTFCQPASVAVEKSGDFYVADGYCNQRIMKYNSKGQLAQVWDTPVAGRKMFVPHKAILNAVEDTLYVADRENSRVLSFSTSDGGRGSVFSDMKEVGGHPYSIFFSGGNSTGGIDWPMYGLLGGFSTNKLLGFALDSSGKRIGTWGPQEGFSRPHDLTVDTVHNAVYVTEIGPNKIWKFVPSPGFDPEGDLERALLNTTSLLPPTTTPHSNSSNSSLILEEQGSVGGGEPLAPVKPTAGVNVGVVVAVVAVLALLVLITVGVLKEHRFIRFQGWRLLQAGERDTTVGVKPSGSTTQREVERERERRKRKKQKKLSPQKRLQSLLGPSNLGFSRLKTYDSNSEDEEFPVFNRV